MFKSARWRSDKNKVKVVFKLQFHAAQVGGDALTISIIPADTGKPTLKLDKAIVRDSRCVWENPVYETVKFNREPKSGKIHEKLYYFVVGTGASKGGVIGEASIDFSHYAELNKVSSVALALSKSQSEAVLYVSIQRLHESDDQRNTEEHENANLSSKENSLIKQFDRTDVEGTIKSNYSDVPSGKVTNQVSDMNVDHRASSESDTTLLSSESSLGSEMHWDPQVKSSIHGNGDESLSLRSQEPENDSTAEMHQVCQKPRWEWLGNSAVEASTDDSSGTPRQNFVMQNSDVQSDILIQNLKSEVITLSRQFDMSELELQTLRKQVLKESKRGQDLSREICSLKEENDALRNECEKLKVCQRPSNEENTKIRVSFEGGFSVALVEELRQELNHAKELNANLHIQLQKTQESNSELILAVGDLEEMLEQKNQEMQNLSDRALTLTGANKNSRELDSACEIKDVEQKALEELIKEHEGAKEESFLEQELADLRGEIVIFKRDKDELEMQMEQLCLDYEIMKQENHEMSYKLEQSQLQEQLKIQYECSSSYATACELEQQIESLKNELKRQSKEFEDSLVVINELEDRAKSLEGELENQAQGFEADIEALTRSKVEQEQRAIRAEETLRKTRCLNANTAERLQEEFRRLSGQMASTFAENERVACKALTEAKELRFQKSHLEEIIRNISEERKSIKCYYEDRLHQLSSEMLLKSNQIERMQSEIENKTGQLEEQKAQARETQRLDSSEILTLKDELEMMKNSTQKMQFLIEEGNNERNELDTSVALLKNEVEELQKDLNNTRRLLEEKEALIGNFQLELKYLQSQYDELKHYLSEDSLEKGNLRKQVLQLKSDLKKKEDALSSFEKKLKDNKSMPLPLANKEIANLKQRIKFLEGQIQLKEIALETSSDTFSKKENNLHKKIKEMEEKLKVINKGSCGLFENEVEKVVEAVEDQEPNVKLIIESRNGDEISTPNPMAVMLPKDDCGMLSKNCNDMNLLNVIKESSFNSGDGENIKEITFLKEKNSAMEQELKEMQERYTEISLKFAEVESERQQLVMRLRNRQSTRNSS